MARFILIKGILYKRGFSRPYLKCLTTDKADYVISAQADSSRILLAYHVEGCPSLCQNLRQVSQVQQHHQTPNRTTMRQLKFLVVSIDYFTKWVEAKALVTIIEKNVRSFVWRNIICRYGIPRVLVLDNRKQFDNKSYTDFCSQLGIRNHYSLLAHPQANGQVNVTNRSLLKIIKTRLEGAKGILPDELPSIL